jgi:pimeloyl-ACP methyl ester carboxylesterase
MGGVILLHGHGRTGRSLRTLSAALAREGYETIALNYGRHGRSMAAIVEHLTPGMTAFAAQCTGPVHIVTHSLGGLVARALLAAHRPDRLGRVVMLAPPNGGSELADLLFRLGLDGLFLGPVGSQLRTARSLADEALLGAVDFDLGIIAGDRPLDPIFPRILLPCPNDGKVSVAATQVPGMSDQIVLPVSHTLMIYNRRVAAQIVAYLQTGHFDRG